MELSKLKAQSPSPAEALAKAGKAENFLISDGYHK